MKIHFIAICGTGMGSLAALMKKQGHQITGSDQNIYPPMSLQLQALQIPLFNGYKPENLNHHPELVIVGNAVSKDNPEVVALLEKKIPYISMAEALSRFFITGKQSIVVAGTHGKTTTTALISHCLTELKADPSYLIGGVPQGGEANIRTGNGNYFVIEGDEYDTAFFDKGPKFWHYQPYHTLITSLEFDHADIYRDLTHLKSAFEKLIEKINPQGFLLACSHYPALLELLPRAPVPVETYGLGGTPLWLASQIEVGQNHTRFQITHKGQNETTLRIPLFGNHNVQNALATYALLKHLGFSTQDIEKSLLSFKGVKRRQEIRGEVNGVVVVDDFAHHPTAVRETIASIRARFPKHELWAIFEPRSNSSKRDIFQKDYAQAFKGADQVVLSDVFMPEKVKDGAILNVDQLVGDIGSHARHLKGVDSIIDYITNNLSKPAVCLIMSNGAFDNIHQKILERLTH